LILLAGLLLAAATLLSALSGLLSLLARVLLLAALILLTHIVPFLWCRSTTNNAGTSGPVPPKASYPLPKVPFDGTRNAAATGSTIWSHI
jgi:hypothetical protein